MDTLRTTIASLWSLEAQWRAAADQAREIATAFEAMAENSEMAAERASALEAGEAYLSEAGKALLRGGAGPVVAQRPKKRTDAERLAPFIEQLKARGG